MNPADDRVLSWAASGAMALTGRANGPPLTVAADPAGAVARGLAALGLASRVSARVLSERAALARLGRRGPTSCGGAFRILKAADGWVGIALPRASDMDLVPALVEDVVVDGAEWRTVTEWALSNAAAKIEDRLALLGMAGGAVNAARGCGRGSLVSTQGGSARHRRQRPLVVDFSALWAGPLCAHLLKLRGAEVIRVESVRRPEPAGGFSAPLRRVLRGDHRVVRVDPPTDSVALRELVALADVVIEASRPRALRSWGLHAEEFVDRGTTWVSITARGRTSSRVGFGDDVAASAGLVGFSDGSPMPAGDAIADPLTGVAAARAASEAFDSGFGHLIDVSMIDVVREAVALAVDTPEHCVVRQGGRWWVETAQGTEVVADPSPPWRG